MEELLFTRASRPTDVHLCPCYPFNAKLETCQNIKNKKRRKQAALKWVKFTQTWPARIARLWKMVWRWDGRRGAVRWKSEEAVICPSIGVMHNQCEQDWRRNKIENSLFPLLFLLYTLLKLNGRKKPNGSRGRSYYGLKQSCWANTISLLCNGEISQSIGNDSRLVITL